ncbi:MAG: acetyl-CoA carboxylase biotin carboxyl carrier protein [Deltaproteobacteria bacterium]|jgi:acetyl-CoA carboxylase, biotin carboxyl carrier protein|uniref:Biotin carboxyl carrier protein of acetyl-CoA carboxylase n=1 Tax=Candidatus Acidulodesulfobacterium acidiphilum TaxID=2597224 RepID=A0A520X765_9DELT|nr:acetyl-CoA carboxylase biotin carboxyl carrier protein [Deltaproteobacteria bacterium]RZV36952.1 MAG: acetyl-CoA carboxylase biotin carboxyl carrier protein [Candidatus Acidulodesulfobacterium acidiphilum]
MNIKDIKDLVKFIKSNKIKEFYYKKGDEEFKVTLDSDEFYKGGRRNALIGKKEERGAQISDYEQEELANFAISRANIAAETDAVSAKVKNERLKEIVSPFVGSFYRSPSPDKPSFVEVDSIVEKGSPVCIVEAMKIMNEIEVDMKCRIVSILAENGQLVEFGQPLFLVEPL